MSNKTNVSTPAKLGAPATTYNPATPPASQSPASPVQGAASASGEAKGAAVKPWQERMTEAGHDSEPDPFNKLCWELEAKDAEIADWRALAERAQAAQASGAVLVGYMHSVDLGKRMAAIYSPEEFSSWPLGKKADITPYIPVYATPAPEQEAASTEATKPACSFCHDTGREWCLGGWGPDNYFDDEMDCTHCDIHTGSAPVPATTPAEQPEGAKLNCPKCHANRLAEPCGNPSDCGMIGTAFLGAANTNKGGEA